MAQTMVDVKLDGRVVILTGADRGLGRSMTLALARAGARMVLASPDVAGLEAVAAACAELTGDEGRALAAPLDITELASCRALAARTLEHFGQIDVLFNNARRFMRGPGIPPTGNSLPVHETDPVIWRETVLVNVVGTFFMTRSVLPHMMERGRGKIVNLTTSWRNFYQPANSPYGVTKAAVESETQIWAADLAGTGITVNSLLPGGACDSDPDRVWKPGQTLLPVDIMNRPAVWLASAGSDGITGGRFVGKLWEDGLDAAKAAQGCREEPVFHGQAL